MIYDYKSDKLVQDIVCDDLSYIIEDIIDEFYHLRRWEPIYVFAPAYIVNEILDILLFDDEDFELHEDSDVELLENDNNEVCLSICHDGTVFVEECRDKNGNLWSDTDSVLNYVYDSFSKSDVDKLSKKDSSVLVFGLDDDSYLQDDSEECCCDECCGCESDENPVCTIKIEGDLTDKDIDKLVDGIQRMEHTLLSMNDFYDEINHFRRLLRF